MYESDEYRTVLINCIQLIFEQCIFLDVHTVFFLSIFSIIIFVFWCAQKFCFYLFATCWTHLLKINKFRHARCIMLIPIPILVDLCTHLVASMTAVHENLSGGLQTLKYCIYVYFDNRPVYDALLLSSLWKHTTVCKISLCISCWIKNSWVPSPEIATMVSTKNQVNILFTNEYNNPICCVATVCHQVRCMHCGHLDLFHKGIP